MSYKKNILGINTFSDDARKTVDELVSNSDKVEDLLFWVESESIIVISGPVNSGKTRLVMEVIDGFRGEGKVIYVDLDTYNEELDIGHLLIGNQSFFRKLFNKMPREMILIVDNAQSLDSDFYRRIQYFFDQGYLKSVILVKKAGSKLELPDSVMSRIGYKVINLKALTKKESISIMSARLNGFLSDEQLEKIWGKSSDFFSFLSNCEKVADAYFDEDRKRIDNKFIEKVLK